jgi:hypothetical protein
MLQGFHTKMTRYTPAKAVLIVSEKYNLKMMKEYRFYGDFRVR